MRPVTVNGGMVMRAWYDIRALDIDRREDGDGVRDSDTAIKALIEAEKARGMASGRIVLAGFSQGGAMALHTGLRFPEPLAGLLALSCYLPLAQSLRAERQLRNQNTPVFMAHGRDDPVVPVALGHAGYQQLKALGYPVQWHDYGMGHEVSFEEIGDIGRWLIDLLA
jgi:phospholipase/carboxylesterase